MKLSELNLESVTELKSKIDFETLRNDFIKIWPKMGKELENKANITEDDIYKFNCRYIDLLKNIYDAHQELQQLFNIEVELK